MSARDPSLTLVSHIALATVLATSATGEPPERCRAAIQNYVNHAIDSGLSEAQIIERLRGARHHADPLAERRWDALLRRFAPPITRSGGTR